MVNSRGASYTFDEDRHLCRVYIDISQDPVVTANQKRDHFWSRVTTTYNSSKPDIVMHDRNQRSLQSRMQNIIHAVSKLNICIQQIERTDHQSGAPELDILHRAKQLLMQDPQFNRGFKFDHVLPLMKDLVKFAAKTPKRRCIDNQLSSSQSDTMLKSTHSPSPPKLSSFSLSISDENVSGGSSSQQSGAKKSNLKRKKGEDISALMKAIQEENEILRNLLLSRVEKDQRNFEIEKQKIELSRWKEENKILMINLHTIPDPRRREYFRKEQDKIILKREGKCK